MTILRIPLIILVWASYMISMTPPLPPAQSTEKDSYGHLSLPVRLMQSTARLQTKAKKAFVSLVLAVEILFAFASTQYGFGGLVAYLWGQAATSSTRAFISPMFVIGVLLALTGGAVRIACYRELGRYFTFELTIRNNHELVTTGPYAIVRHPSYTGILFVSAGITICELASGSWWTETHALQGVVGKWIAFGWIACLFIKLFVISRAPKEDAMLRETFGRKWEEYAIKVQHRFLPGLI